MKYKAHTALFYGIIFAAAILRFVSYEKRWGLGPDQAAFAVTGLYALRHWQLPLLGPFSSGGPFQTGGEWYWLVMLGQALFPHPVYGAWIFMGLLSLAFIALIAITGSKLGGMRTGLIAAALSAVSTAQMTQSLNLSNQTPVSLFSLVTLAAGIGYIQTGTSVYLFLLGLSTGIASAIHLQGIALVPATLMVCLLKRPKLRDIAFLITGLILPWLPVFLADSRHHWFNTTSMIHYYLVDQYAISLNVLGRNWRTFLSVNLPHFWAFTIGNYPVIGILTMIICLISGGIALWRKQLSKEWMYIAGSFFCMVVMVRYAHVPLYESFVVFLHPFILLLTAGGVNAVFTKSAKAGALFFLVLTGASMIKNAEEIKNSTNLSHIEATRIQTFLTRTYPKTTFRLSGRFSSYQSSQLFMYLYYNRLVSPTGKRIGLTAQSDTAPVSSPIVYTDTFGTKIYDLDDASPSAMLAEKWSDITADGIYKSTQNWFTE